MNNLQLAIDYFGNQEKLAKALGIHAMTTTQWKKRGIPPKRAKQIEQVTNGQIKAKDLLPDLFS